MPELIIEIHSEEIPASMQKPAAERLLQQIIKGFRDRGIAVEDGASACFSTPRRLAVVVKSLPARQPDSSEERRGPSVDAPPKAIEGFLKSVGLTRDRIEERDTDKGSYLFARIDREGRPTTDIIEELLPQIMRGFQWPKSMRWGAGSLRWVRPIRSVLCLFDGKAVEFEVDGIKSGDTTRGHPFLAPTPFAVTGIDDYRQKLLGAKVILGHEDRGKEIVSQGSRLESEGLKCEFDKALLDEVAGLVEWPVVLMGAIDEAFMDLPAEVLVTAMQKHQKYFSVTDPRSGAMAPFFVVVANLEAGDAGKRIVRGNERVLRARLADAKFFWRQDRKMSLKDRVPALDSIVFHARLGTMGERVARLRDLAAAIAPYVPGADAGEARQAALLAKADLTTEMVGEFPGLQGAMGQYYAIAEGLGPDTAMAIREHYAPQGPADDCPSAPLSVTVALADKIDTLVGFFAIGETPTGSKDPFALRRAALGVIRLITENGLRLPLEKIFAVASGLHGLGEAAGLLDFLADRLKVHLRGKGVRHDLIEAVFAVGGEDDLVRLLSRVAALEEFLASDDGANLLVAYRRAANIVRIEEKRDGRQYDGAIDEGLLTEDDERSLFQQLDAAIGEARAALSKEDFAAAMSAIAALRGPVDSFFDNVTVNCEDGETRANRLGILARIRRTLHTVADFSRIGG